jgi:succinate dehydrogenase / fumarate reductase membrane anchor subunit
MNGNDMRTPLSRVRYRGAAHSGTQHFWRQRLTSVALVPLSIGVIAIILSLLGRNQAAAARVLGSPVVAVTMLLFIVTSAYHAWLGMQVIIEDYVHHELAKIGLLIASIFFCIVVALASAFAIFQLSFGV